VNYSSLDFSSEFLESLVSRDFTPHERVQFIKALRLLDADERHPSLRVHALEGQAKGVWSALASTELRITFRRTEGGRKRLLACSRHYR
jgi:mRNA-degrading endonuclease YafQ of YafQ-DinJ toxin-antitoxin module